MMGALCPTDALRTMGGLPPRCHGVRKVIIGPKDHGLYTVVSSLIRTFHTESFVNVTYIATLQKHVSKEGIRKSE